MAHRFFAINQGQHDTDVLEGSSTQAKNVELNVDLAQAMSKEDVLLALEYLTIYITKGKWPPA